MKLNYPLMARHILAASLFLAALSACEREPLPSADPSSQLITDVIIIDGTGAARLEGSVRFMNAEIISVGDLEARPGERIIDGGGLVLAPGFIDTHSHVESELFEQPGALAAVSQGITTAIIGQDGDSPFPLLDFRFRLMENPVAINIASFAGHNSMRGYVMG
jgi:N-acyl-D-amino-acid deacylase